MIDPLNFDCTFRPAMNSDYDDLHRLLYSCWLETYGRQVSPKTVRRFTDEDCVGEHLRLFLNSTQVADVDGRVVGAINRERNEWPTAFGIDGIGFWLSVRTSALSALA
ncbi:hypothetical protein ACC688_29035 [Rhizobium ruizarguesonis]